MPAVDDPFSIAASLPGQMATLKGQLKDQSVTNTQALTQALAAATAASNAANAAATAAYNAAVTAAVGHGTASSFSLSTTPAELTRATITVPAGYTRALVFGTSSMTMNLTSYSAADFIRGYIDINGNAAPVSGGMATQNATTMVAVSYSCLLTGLSGGSTFYVRAIYYNEAGSSGAASARNICNLDAIVTFLR